MRSVRRITGPVAGLVAGALLGVALAGCATPVAVPGGNPTVVSSADSEIGSTSGPSAERALDVGFQLDQVVADIEKGRAEADIPGLAGLEVDVEASAVTVYWVGEPPDHVRQIAASPPPGITLNLRSARYDIQAMIAAIDKVFAAYGDDLNAASPNLDGTGITVEKSADDLGHGATADAMSELAGMPVTIEVGDGATALDG